MIGPYSTFVLMFLLLQISKYVCIEEEKTIFCIQNEMNEMDFRTLKRERVEENPTKASKGRGPTYNLTLI